MKNCPACGFPAPRAAPTCAYCSAPFERPAAASYRLTGDGYLYEWRAGDALIAAATWSGTTGHVRRAGETLITHTLVGVADPARVAVVGEEARLVATLVDAGAMTQVWDPADDLCLLVKSDGPTGIHAIDPQGNVVALASRDHVPGHGRGGSAAAPGEVALDVLVLRPWAEPAGGLFAILLAAERLRLGRLDPAA